MYQVKPHSSPWFSAACAAAIVHRNHLFRLYQQNKCSESKVQSSDRLVIIAKGFLNMPNLYMLIKQKSQELGSRDLRRIANSILKKGKSAIPPLFNGLEVLIN